MADVKPKVMVIEDDSLLSDLLLQKLADHFELLYAPTGEIALETLQTNVPDIILLDIMLPGIDGFEVLKRIKENPASAGVPIIVLSNLGKESDVEQGTKLGAEKFVVKVSLTPDEIVHLVKTSVASKSTPVV